MSEVTMQASAPVRRRGGPTGYEYGSGVCRPLSGFARPLSVLLVIYVVVCGLFVLATSYWLIDPRMFEAEPLVQGNSPEDERLFLALGIFSLVAIAERLLMFTCAFFVGRFTYRAMKNLYTVRSPVPDMSPIGTVLWYLVPFANLVKPSQGVYEIYAGSFEEAGLPAKTGVVSRWWGVWVVGLISGAISNFSFVSTEVVFGAVMVSVVSGAIAALLLRGIIHDIAEAQEAMIMGGRVSAFD
jgi:hypothetical protein